jgi:hypothetical protein
VSAIAERAIARSVSHTEIVTIAYDADAAAALQAACEDSVGVPDERTEYWGTTDDGDEWRVHMRAETLDEDLYLATSPDLP